MKRVPKLHGTPSIVAGLFDQLVWVSVDGLTERASVLLCSSLAVPVGKLVLPLFGAIGIHAFGNRVAMNAERFRGVRNPLLVSSESLLNVELLKLVKGLIQEYVAVEHILNNSF